MSVTTAKTAFAAGEISPSAWGRIDLSKFSIGAATMRNCFASYRGGACSRAGTRFVGQSFTAASAASTAPRIITFQFAVGQSYIIEFGNSYARFITNGGYVTEAPFNITAASQANPCQLTAPGNNFANGDWIFVAGVVGMTALNSQTFVLANVNAGAGTFTLKDTFGNPISSLAFAAYVSGGTAARIYTIATPYLIGDLPYLKWTQSADVMSLTLVSQSSPAAYQPQELTRLAAASWNITPPTIASSIAAPGSSAAAATTKLSALASPNNVAAAQYAYVVTAVDAKGQESLASPIATTISDNVNASVDISITAGSINVTWIAVLGAVSYNIYKAPAAIWNTGSAATNTPATVPAGSMFGYVGSATGTAFVDQNVIQNFAITPPLHVNPFVGSNNYPGVVAYFQQRRVYAQSRANPDTFEMSQPGQYTNFDSADPPIDSDAITATPWGQQVNGIQWLIPMTSGLIVGTGLDVWLLTGASGVGSPVTPASESATSQETNGFSPTVPPIKINYELLFVQALGSVVRSAVYNFFNNTYSSQDLTILSNHLFDGHTIVQWAWAREPYKLVWAVRDDGVLLSLTYVKEQEVIAWAHHDTNGTVVSVAVASEPPVDALYLVVKRFIAGKSSYAYYVERMDNRIWLNAEQPWCVDAGLALTPPTPSAVLSASSATGSGPLTGINLVAGGAGYTAPTATLFDPTGAGSGASISLTVAGGIITGAVVVSNGTNYSAQSVIRIADTTGTGASLIPILSLIATFTASAGEFDGVTTGAVGQIIRMGGGKATVTQYVSPTQVLANITMPILALTPDDPGNLPLPAAAGTWSIATPVSSVSGLNHLEGMTVTGLADGAVIPATVVVNGTIALSSPATAVVVGLGFQAQVQSLPLEIAGQPTIQGKRKKIPAVTVRLERSRGVKLGSDQPNASEQENGYAIPWGVAPYGKMIEVKEPQAQIRPGSYIPLFTGDHRIPIDSDWNRVGWSAAPGMVAAQQDNPLPMNVLAFFPESLVGDSQTKGDPP